MRWFLYIQLLVAFGISAAAQTALPEHCPTISVTGPAGITRPGELITFSSNPPLKDINGLRFHWAISAGTIEKGDGTPEIAVRTTREMNNINVTATVEISGLSDGCPRVASETAAVSSGFHPMLIDEFGKLPLNDVRGRLDTFFGELSSHTDQVGVIILHFAERTSESKLQQRKKIIENHIKLRRFPRNRILIFRRASEWENTQLYRMPPWAVDPYCSECEKY